MKLTRFAKGYEYGHERMTVRFQRTLSNKFWDIAMKVKIFFLAYYKVLKFENLMFLNEPLANFLEPSRAREGIWWKSSNEFIVHDCRLEPQL